MSASNDTSPPGIFITAITPPTVAAGGSVAVQVQLADSGTGVVGGSLSATRVSPPGDIAPLDAPLALESGTPFEGTWRGIVAIPATYAAGQYELKVRDVVDAAGNRAAPVGGAFVTVTGG